MQATMKTSMRPACSTRRSAVVVRAQSQESTSRRALLGFVAAAVGAAALAAPQAAQAIKLPWQESTGGLVAGGGSSPKSPTRASMEGYNLEGTKKQGITPKRKQALLAKARKAAEEVK